MYYFLGIVLKDDIHKGRFIPSFVLSAITFQEQANRSNFRMKYTPNGGRTVKRKILFTNLVDNDDIIEYFSCYRARYRRRKKYNKQGYSTKTQMGKKYIVKGALFFFECNMFGQRTGPCLFVKNIPDFKYRDAMDGAYKNKTFKPILKDIWSEQQVYLKDVLVQEKKVLPQILMMKNNDKEKLNGNSSREKA